jgi:hypothetical protein
VRFGFRRVPEGTNPGAAIPLPLTPRDYTTGDTAVKETAGSACPWKVAKELCLRGGQGAPSAGSLSGRHLQNAIEFP